jgi:uncharacterized transporter YbjL
MQTKHSSGVIAVVLVLATFVVMFIGISMNAYAQNTTQTTDMITSNMTNTTGLVSEDDAGEGAEEGPGEDEDEPGDTDVNDEED